MGNGGKQDVGSRQVRDVFQRTVPRPFGAVRSLRIFRAVNETPARSTKMSGNPRNPMPSYQEIVALEQKYLLNTYARYPVALARGKGMYLFDVEGKRYLDFLSGLGVNALGHAHPRIVKVIREQAAKVIHLSNLYYNEYQGLLAEKLCQKSGLDRAFFTNSGTEAVEGALKLVRAVGHATTGPHKTRVLALENSFHGRTMGALALTAQDKYRTGFDPMLEGVRFVPSSSSPSKAKAASSNRRRDIFRLAAAWLISTVRHSFSTRSSAAWDAQADSSLLSNSASHLT